MGMFDTVHFDCPTCGEKFEEQTKAGDCCLFNYHHTSVPYEIAIDLEDVECHHCGSRFEVATPARKRIALKLLRLDEEGLVEEGDWD